jgi:hypothetical protein
MSMHGEAHTCISSYLGGRDQEDHDLKPAWAKSSPDSISINKSSVVVCVYNPICLGDIGRRIWVPGQP